MCFTNRNEDGCITGIPNTSTRSRLSGVKPWASLLLKRVYLLNMSSLTVASVWMRAGTWRAVRMCPEQSSLWPPHTESAPPAFLTRDTACTARSETNRKSRANDVDRSMHYGIDNVENRVFCGYLSNWYQYVEYDRAPSVTELED